MNAPHGLTALPADWRPWLASDDRRFTALDAQHERRFGEHADAIAAGLTTAATVRRQAFIAMNLAAADAEFTDTLVALAATEQERDAWRALGRFHGATAPATPSGTDAVSLAAAGIKARRAKRELIDAALAADYRP